MIDLRDRQALAPLAAVITDIRAQAADLDFLLIGAAARDLLLLHHYGLTAPRRTTDVDLAFWLADWAAFDRLRARLLGSGAFSGERCPHRLRHRPTGTPIDIVPFGGIESAVGEIAWPPDANPIMSVIGYDVALACAEALLLPGGQTLKAISLPLLALVKLLTWEARRRDSPRKDALDLLFVLDCASQVVGLTSLLDEAPGLVEREDFDVALGGAWLLGAQARRALDQHSRQAHAIVLRVASILHRETDPHGPLELIGELRSADPEQARHTLAAFANGLQAVVALRGTH